VHSRCSFVVSLPQKWAVAIAMTILFMSLSSGFAWYPITHLELRLSHISLVYWVCFHASAAALFVSILLLLDTFDWGEWLGLRALVSFVMILPFLWAMGQEFNRFWGSTALCATLATICAAVAIGAAPALSRESPLPHWRWQIAVGQHRFTPDQAFVWLLWRQMRSVTLLLLVPVPLLIVIGIIPAFLYSGRLDLHSFLGPVLSTVSRAIPGFLCIVAGVFGLTLPAMEAQSKAESFRWALPLPRARAQRIRLLFALALLGLIFIPPAIMAAARALWFEPDWAGDLLRDLAEQLFASIAICSAMLALVSYARNGTSVVDYLATVVGLCFAVFVAGVLFDFEPKLLLPKLPLLFALAAVVTAAAWMLLPVIDRSRELD
jgi:hypothetical protein